MTRLGQVVAPIPEGVWAEACDGDVMRAVREATRRGLIDDGITNLSPLDALRHAREAAFKRAGNGLYSEREWARVVVKIDDAIAAFEVAEL